MKTFISLLLIILASLTATNIALARSHPYFILDITVSNDGRYVAISRIDDKLILLYDLDQKKVLKVFTNDRGIQATVVFTPDSKYFVFDNPDHELLFYDIAKGEITKKYPLEKGAYSMAFFSDNNRFIWGSGNGKIEYVDMEKNEKVQLKPPVPPDIISSFDEPILHIKISPDEKYFLTTTFTNGSAALWPEPDEDFKYEEKTIYFSKELENEGKGWTTQGWRVRHLGLNLWDAKTLKKVKKLGAEFVEGRCWPSFSSDSKYILAPSENGLALFNIESSDLFLSYHHLTDSAGFISDKSFAILDAADAHLILCNTSKNVDEVKDTKKSISLKYPPCTGAIATVPDKNLIVIGTQDGSISIYKYLPDKHDIKLEWHPKSISAGLIRWLSPLETLTLNEVEIDELQRRYEEAQKNLIEKESKQGVVETKYHELPVPSK